MGGCYYPGVALDPSHVTKIDKAWLEGPKGSHILLKPLAIFLLRLEFSLRPSWVCVISLVPVHCDLAYPSCCWYTNGKEMIMTQIHVSLKIGKKHWHTSNISCTYMLANTTHPSAPHGSTWGKVLICISSLHNNAYRHQSNLQSKGKSWQVLVTESMQACNS